MTSLGNVDSGPMDPCTHGIRIPRGLVVPTFSSRVGSLSKLTRKRVWSLILNLGPLPPPRGANESADTPKRVDWMPGVHELGWGEIMPLFAFPSAVNVGSEPWWY